LTVLAKNEILKLINSGKIKIKPFNPDQVGPGSVDLHLGNTFRIFKKTHKAFHVTDNVDYKKITEMVEVKNGSYFLVLPGQLIHGITKETVSLPDNICGRIEGRSRFARIGLVIHLSSGFVHPGTINKTVLEIANLSPIPLAIYPGTRICQIIFEDVKGRGKYRGKFHLQDKP
jgi:dCTP deaminase